MQGVIDGLKKERVGVYVGYKPKSWGMGKGRG
jgi:hypothetical protein